MAKYLYCIIGKPYPKKFKIKGIDKREVYTISQGNFSMVVSDTETKEFFPLRENLIAHQKVIEEILKKYTLLPISFGTIAKSRDEAKTLLKENGQEILKILKKIEGKIELGLKVFWQNMPAIFEEIAKENREIQETKAKGAVTRKTMLRAGEMVARALEQKKSKESAFILQSLAKIAKDFKENKLFRDDMILNVNFLVERKKEKDFDKTIDKLDKKYGQRLKFKYVGPTPPANFVEMRLKI